MEPPGATPHTVILSDIHLTDAEPPSSHRLWKAYKRSEHFVDGEIEQLLETLQRQGQGQGDAPIELILNGDIFDFDSVMTMPLDAAGLNLFEKWRGMAPEEPKSLFKMRAIIHDHPVFFEALAAFLGRGHRVVFVIGNHDLELSWPGVQALVRETLGADEAAVCFADWFYLSNKDTLVEHGHLHDSFCTAIDPLHPFIRRRGVRRVRLPFGNLAERYMINGMGPMNPHVDSSFIKSNVGEYVRFFVQEILPVQPLLVWTWFWGACLTFGHAMFEAFLPAEQEPTSLQGRVEQIARRANVEPGTVWAMREHRAQSAVYRPWVLAQELWIDRVFVIGASLLLALQLYSIARLFRPLPLTWLGLPVFLCLSVAFVYTFGVRSSLAAALQRSREAALLSARLTGVSRVVHGHTHEVAHTRTGGIEYLNPGTWSPAFHDSACTKRFGERCIVSLRPRPNGGPRVGQLFVFEQGGLRPWRAPEPVRARRPVAAVQAS
jgi:UDP-2,3-diacylglucosamine pyrophosphatase LpxH